MKIETQITTLFVSIAVDQANADLLKQLTQQWRDGWRKALPPGKLN